MGWTELFFRIVARRGWMLLAVAAVGAFAFVALRLTPRLEIPRPGDGFVLILALWSGVLMTWRAADERTGRRRIVQAFADWQAVADRFLGRMQAFIVPGRDDEVPESDELKTTMARRQSAIIAVHAALRHGREPAEDADMKALTTAIERMELKGKALLARLIGLQRDALVEAERRQWLSGPRFTALEADLATLAEAPEPARTWSSGYTRLTSLTVAATALLIPLAASTRLSAIAVGTGVGMLLVAFDALSD
jgi:hypothetical protein